MGSNKSLSFSEREKKRFLPLSSVISLFCDDGTRPHSTLLTQEQLRTETHGKGHPSAKSSGTKALLSHLQDVLTLPLLRKPLSAAPAHRQ